MGCSLSVLKEGREADCCYRGRGRRRTIRTQGWVGGGFIGKCYGLIKFFSRKPLKIRESFFSGKS